MYINQEDQLKIEELINEYITLSNGGEIANKQTEHIMSVLFIDYFDKMINGVIFNQQYRFWRYAEIDDLIQEARTSIITSIHKKQFNRSRGNVFNFFSTVVSKNLMNYTKKQNRYLFNNVSSDINEIFNNENVQYTQNYTDFLIIEEAFRAMRKFFDGKDKFVALVNLLQHYYELNTGKKFVKKKFIAFAKAHNFSPASVNIFFAYSKKMKFKKEIKILLDLDA